MIDFHCHLDLYSKPLDVVRECSQRGMYVLSVTTTPSAWSGSNSLALGYHRVRTALGLHPQLVGERRREITEFDRLLSGTRYVGEVGLDRGAECLPYWRDQVEVFRHVLASCTSAGGRIMSIHSRRAEEEVLACLESFPKAGTPVLHWFSGSRRNLGRAVQLGCWFSVGPSMLLSKKGRELIELMPRDRVLTESDGPFAIYDGRPAFPWDVQAAIIGLGQLWHVSENDVKTRLRENLNALVGTITAGEHQRGTSEDFLSSV